MRFLMAAIGLATGTIVPLAAQAHWVTNCHWSYWKQARVCERQWVQAYGYNPGYARDFYNRYGYWPHNYGHSYGQNYGYYGQGYGPGYGYYGYYR